MIKRAQEKQAEIRAYLLSLDLGSGSAQLPWEDCLTTDDWRLLNDIQHVLEPIYNLTMRTQGHTYGGIHGQLWELMTGMEFVLEHLEEWKALYDDPATESAAELASQQTSETLSPRSGSDTVPRSSTPTTPSKDCPTQQSRLPQHPRGFEIVTPLRQQQQQQRRHQHPVVTASTTTQFNEAGDERTYMKACIDNAWVKLNECYALLGDSPLYATSIILHPGLGISFLEANWTSPMQLAWLMDAKRQLKESLEKWYPALESEDSLKKTPKSSPSPVVSAKKDPGGLSQWIRSKHPKSTQAASELDMYYRIEPQEVSDPIPWWVGHKGTFPRLSRFALDILAIPAMEGDCERAFIAAEPTMKNWTRSGSIELGIKSRAAQRQE
ncbi:hypothetical protein VTI28DRAFT_565 [Corynascus sepedonium]